MPDLRYANRLAPGETGVRIELSISEERVLLSDFDTWHMVLSGSFLARNEREWNRLHRSGSRGEKLKTWERIFDLRDRSDDEWLGRLTHIQAVIEEVRLSDVLSARRFVSR